MLGVVSRSILVTLGVILVSQIISYSGRMATGQEFTSYVFFMNSFLPLITALPASLLIFWQQHRLNTAHVALTEAHSALSHKAAHDGLTGLLNRETFLARIHGSGGFLLIDADNFKIINDTFGHAEGDTALRLISVALRTAAGANGLVGRLGGEEFGVFMPSATAAEAVEVAEQIRAAVAEIEYLPIRSRRHALSVSVGVALASSDADFEQTFRRADANLYDAKAAGRNAVVASTAKAQLTAAQ